MKSVLFYRLGAGAAALFTIIGVSPAASAQATGTTYQVNFTQQNKSGGSGSGTVTVTGNTVVVTIRGNGFSPNIAHATHLHIGGQATCPTPAADSNKDGYVDAKEAEPYVGAMKVSLSTSGDTSANSALALERAPKADAQGSLTYSRSFTLPNGVSGGDLAKASLDIHGISSLFDDRTKYDGSKESELDNKVAFEATVPAACGQLVASPTGGAATGAGAVTGIESPELFVVGTAALFGAVAAAYIAHRQLNQPKN